MYSGLSRQTGETLGDNFYADIVHNIRKAGTTVLTKKLITGHNFWSHTKGILDSRD